MIRWAPGRGLIRLWGSPEGSPDFSSVMPARKGSKGGAVTFVGYSSKALAAEVEVQAAGRAFRVRNARYRVIWRDGGGP